jgi:hypothetical protein
MEVNNEITMLSSRIMAGFLLRANFTLTDTLPLKNGTFLAKILSSQNLKVAIYKNFRISARQK